MKKLLYFLYFFVPYCTLLYLIDPFGTLFCILLYLIVPYCTFLYLFVPFCIFLYLLVFFLGNFWEPSGLHINVTFLTKQIMPKIKTPSTQKPRISQSQITFQSFKMSSQMTNKRKGKTPLRSLRPDFLSG